MGATFSRFFIESPGNTILAAHYNGEFDNILTNLTPAGVDDDSVNLAAMKAVTSPGGVGTESLATSSSGEFRRIRYMLKLLSGMTQWYEAPPTNLNALNPLFNVPIGVPMAFYDFNGFLTKPTNFAFCDGSVISDVDSPLNGKTLPDFSGRSFVGFGTDGGADIGTATWSDVPVGNAGNQINLSHTHVDAGHVHAHAHTHTIAHTHDAGSLAARIIGYFTGGNRIVYDAKAMSTWTDDTAAGISGTTGVPADNHTSGAVVDGTTDGSNSANSGAASASNTSSSTANNGNALSATQSIANSAIQCRVIMRIK